MANAAKKPKKAPWTRKRGRRLGSMLGEMAEAEERDAPGLLPAAADLARAVAKPLSRVSTTMAARCRDTAAALDVAIDRAAAAKVRFDLAQRDAQSIWGGVRGLLEKLAAELG